MDKHGFIKVGDLMHTIDNKTIYDIPTTSGVAQLLLGAPGTSVVIGLTIEETFEASEHLAGVLLAPTVAAGALDNKALMLASKNGSRSLLRKMLDAGCDKDAQDEKGNTCAHLAASSMCCEYYSDSCWIGFMDVLELLAESKANFAAVNKVRL